MLVWWHWCGLWRDRKRGAGLRSKQFRGGLAMTKSKQPALVAGPNMAPLPTLLSVEATAQQLSVSTKTIRRLIERGALPSCHVGRLVRIRAVDLATFVASGTGS
jgi:excisionase family DNA binding protein